jgi:hypothetical protein
MELTHAWELSGISSITKDLLKAIIVAWQKRYYYVSKKKDMELTQ